MRKVLQPVLVACTILVTAAAPALAAPSVCISTRDIKDSHQEGGGASLLFTMRDGSVYRNKLLGKCPDLVFNGFAWTIRNPDGSVCDNMETIHVLQSGQVCQLGKFEKVTPVPKAPS